MTLVLGCVGTLIKASGVDILISAAVAGITSLVNRNASTNALLAYHLITTVLLHNLYSNGAKTCAELNVYLETAREHPTGRRWLDCLVKPTLLSLMLLRGERNGDFLFQQHCLKVMLPYFCAAGHHNYARYLSWYVRQMEHFPHSAKEDLLASALVCRHSDGGVKGSGGMKGIFNEPRASGCVGE